MIRTLFLLILSALAWLVWQQPAPAPSPAAVRNSIPGVPLSAHSPNENAIAKHPGELWRVVTRRLVTPEAAKALSRSLQKLKLEPIKFERRESIEMHAFDDQFLFSSRKNAAKAQKDWLKRKIKATVIKIDDKLYTVDLGRFFYIEYAEDLQKQLKKAGKPYRYQRRNVTIPAWRFTFAPTGRQQAGKLWKQLQSSGISMPVLMPEERFQETYGDVQQ